MNQLCQEHLAMLRSQLGDGVPATLALPIAIGKVIAAGGLWRFYSDNWPGLGISWWNLSSPWRVHWNSMLAQGVFSFGEDIFGNQLVLVANDVNMHLLDHESGEMHALHATPLDVLSCVSEAGIDWIDFYRNRALSVARHFGVVAVDCHLHWVTPLVLGGGIASENLCVMPRDEHHTGHAKLWAQVIGLAHGSQVTIGLGRRNSF